jgi:hypothetical protein
MDVTWFSTLLPLVPPSCRTIGKGRVLERLPCKSVNEVSSVPFSLAPTSGSKAKFSSISGSASIVLTGVSAFCGSTFDSL